VSAKELRCCTAEAIGAFAIVFFGCGAIAIGVADHLAVNLVFGATVAAMVFSLAHVSCAHFNPAVSVAFAVVQRFPWRLVGPYVVAQVVGALAACLALTLVVPGGLLDASSFGETVSSVGAWQTVGAEAVLTFFLMMVIVSVATDARAAGTNAAIAIGLAVFIGGLMGGPLTGGSMNPARSLAPALFSGELGGLWTFLLGPVVGAGLGAAAYEFMRSPGKVERTAPASCCEDC
jgi:MIP family channel proteins